jgi:hypothetical protein
MTEHAESGVGRVWRLNVLALDRAPYELHYTTENDADRQRTRREHGFARLHGLRGALKSTFPMWLIGHDIELELEDGRRWRCALHSHDGVLMDRGGLYRRQAPL